MERSQSVNEDQSDRIAALAALVSALARGVDEELQLALGAQAAEALRIAALHQAGALASELEGRLGVVAATLSALARGVDEELSLALGCVADMFGAVAL